MCGESCVPSGCGLGAVSGDASQLRPVGDWTGGPPPPRGSRRKGIGRGPSPVRGAPKKLKPWGVGLRSGVLSGEAGLGSMDCPCVVPRPGAATPPPPFPPDSLRIPSGSYFRTSCSFGNLFCDWRMVRGGCARVCVSIANLRCSSLRCPAGRRGPAGPGPREGSGLLPGTHWIEVGWPEMRGNPVNPTSAYGTDVDLRKRRIGWG